MSNLKIRAFLNATTIGSTVSGLGLIWQPTNLFEIVLVILALEGFETALSLWILPRLKRSLITRFKHMMKR